MLDGPEHELHDGSQVTQLPVARDKNSFDWHDYPPIIY